MPMHVCIPIQVPAGVRVNASWGSLFHGAMIERFPTDLAGALHTSVLKPWSHYLSVTKDGRIIWYINALTDQMTEAIDQALLAALPLKLHLKQKNIDVFLDKPESIEKQSYMELADRSFTANDLCRSYVLSFVTPTTFKTNGNYALYPTTDLIFNSLAQKWDAFSPEISVVDPDVRQHLASQISIHKYHLGSAPFSVDGSWLTGFEGRIEMHMKGPEALCRIADLLIQFSIYSGVGIKTALGMGGVKYEKLGSVLTAGHDRPIP